MRRHFGTTPGALINRSSDLAALPDTERFTGGAAASHHPLVVHEVI